MGSSISSYRSNTSAVLNISIPGRAQAPTASSSELESSADAPKSTREIYKPLDDSSDSIRLIVLKPADYRDEATVRCELIHVKFRDKPIYEALSYTWGNADDTRTILIDGIEVSVGANLYEALSFLRAKSGDRILWADAICINQNDQEEKNHQVRSMGWIYERAACVIIWLGVFAGWDPGSYDYRRNNWGSEIVTSRPYWNRLWVIQEIALSRNLKVHAGHFSEWWETAFCQINCARVKLLNSKRIGRHGDSNRLEQLLEDF